MVFVRQKTKTDCGIATLAMLCNVSYEEASDAIQWRATSGNRGTTTHMLREAARKLGYTTKSTPQKRLKVIKVPDVWVGKTVGGELWQFIPANSLVKIPYRLGRYGWHWVVWNNDKIYDPARGVFLPRKYDKSPISYMEFVKCRG